MSMQLDDALAMARGDKPVDLLVKNCRLVNVLSGDIHDADVAVAGGVVIGFGNYEAKDILDAQGRHLCPGLIDGHLHIESTLLSPPEFARAVARHGTAAVVADPHEIANVLGVQGVRYMLEASRDLPVQLYYMAPSCVPATDMETAGAVLNVEEISGLLEEYPGRILGLGEMMNFPGVIHGDRNVLAKLQASAGRPIDGHAPLVTGKDLNAYLLGGPTTDHECTRLDEAREKLRKGMHLMIREGSSQHNLLELLPAVNDFNAHRVSFVSDDRDPQDLLEKGHLDYSIRLAIAHGFPAMRAIQASSINTARHYGLNRQGAVAPGFRADFILLDDLETFKIHEIFLGGRPLDRLSFESPAVMPGNSMNIPPEFFDNRNVFDVPAASGDLRVIGCMPGQVLTENRLLPPAIVDGKAVADARRDLAKLAVVERHTGSGRCSIGFAQGLKLHSGSLASTVAHDSHNLIIAGMDDDDMRMAGKFAIEIGGGFVVVDHGKVLASLPLPLAGLMSDFSLERVVECFKDFSKACEAICEANPFMTLSFLALPVIPSLKLTDRGLVDVNSFSFTTLWADKA